MGFFRDDFLVLTPETFAAEVLGHPGPVFVLFCQGWDKPSKMQIAELEYLQQNHPGLKICKVDGGDYPELLQQFRVLMMPTTVCFAAGRAVRRATGLRTKETLELLLPPDYVENPAQTVQEVTAATFDAEVLQAEGTVLVLFYGGSQQSSRLETAELQALLDKRGGFQGLQGGLRGRKPPGRPMPHPPAADDRGLPAGPPLPPRHGPALERRTGTPPGNVTRLQKNPGPPRIIKKSKQTNQRPVPPVKDAA